MQCRAIQAPSLRHSGNVPVGLLRALLLKRLSGSVYRQLGMLGHMS